MTIYCYHKQSKGYEIVKCDFQPLQFHARVETHYANIKTLTETCKIVARLNNCQN